MATRDEQATRYWPTPAAYAAHLNRGACGHVLCAYSSGCSISIGLEPMTQTTTDTEPLEAP